MKQPKPLLTIKQKCRCVDFSGAVKLDCKFCKGTGQQEIKIYDLRDFEKCHVCKNGILHLLPKKLFPDRTCQRCNGTGYIIPKEYEPYEIKKVSEIELDERPRHLFLDEHNLKEDDKVVISN